MDTAIPAGMHTRTAIHFLEQALKFLSFERDTHPSREVSIAITELETAMMWAQKDRSQKAPEEVMIDVMDSYQKLNVNKTPTNLYNDTANVKNDDDDNSEVI